MTAYERMRKEELRGERERVQAVYDALKARGLRLDMSRGKPGKEQLDLSVPMLSVLQTPEDCFCDGIDVRNYGMLTGLPSAKKLFAALLGCEPEQCLIGGNASLQLMYDLIAKAYTHGLLHSVRPWAQERQIKWLCPAPGYDRHFAISLSFGMQLLAVPMLPTGPDMDRVEALVQDPDVRGIWCVPKYSNPDGIVYSEETVLRIASLRPAAPDFTVMWDNAYCVHAFDGPCAEIPEILSLSAAAGNPDMVCEFASTSKITLPGAGISVLATSAENLHYLETLLFVQVISFDKVNQLRHVRFLQDRAHTLALMERHAALLRPKFRCVLDALERELAPLGLAAWQTPRGGYFVSVNVLPGLAKRIHALCRAAGVTLTAAGATYPYGLDPNDSNLRIAPSLPPLCELETAMDVFCTAVKLAALERLIPQQKSATTDAFENPNCRCHG